MIQISHNRREACNLRVLIIFIPINIIIIFIIISIASIIVIIVIFSDFLYKYVMIHCTVVCCVDESGVAAQIAEPLADVQMPTYYISTYGLGHTLVCTNLWVIEVLWET